MANLPYYFGCHHNTGHRLYGPGMSSVPKDTRYTALFNHLDNVLVDKDLDPYFITETKFLNIEYLAYAWKDYTVDTRPGSNSMLFMPFDYDKSFKACLYMNFKPVYDRYKSKGINLYMEDFTDNTPYWSLIRID